MGNVLQSVPLQNMALYVVIVLVFFWIVSIVWVAKDIFSRTNSTSFQLISILLVTFLTPIIGLPLYFAIRPVYYKKDQLLWREALMTDLIQCYNCSGYNEKNHRCCVYCGEHLKITCKECGGVYSYTYHYCNGCGAPNIEI